MVNKKTLEKYIKTGDSLVYDFGFENYWNIKPERITKTKGQHVWFDAIRTDDGTRHSFSNSFVSESLEQAKIEKEKYKETQIKFLIGSFLSDRGC